MSKWFDGYVKTNGLKIHYYRTGGDKPQVVLNHGSGDDGLCWTRIVKELESRYDVILPDARGHGKSASGKKDYASRSRVNDLAGLIQALRLERPVVGGHSLGADTSLQLAAEFPQLTRAIFLEDPPIFLPGESLFDGEQVKGKDVGKMMRQFMMMFKLMPRFIAIRMARKNSPAYPDDEILPWVDSKKRMSFDFLNSMSTMDFNVPDPLAPFKKIQMPVLLFIGDKEKMSIVSQKTAAEAVRRNARVQVVHLEGASHDIRRTRFDGYMPALKKFLETTYSA
ncbi:MAG TPA: alpha/beta hydrolase [Anaerolineales bacterium]|jgi:pimeloyl-ACP methyl ester carboxylesterase|nr:alpha/beta hydrolase [Anaerolineales bacterium]HNB34658.1 alpha/beta hydrolase [Anaerolineales bacterium]HNC07657.1 alpha/beta hydrolase [Anaerolineales bacterium]HNJ11966.1 alpha/beta hydrolase [Anaerolineales bacterium]